ncbi:MAG: response regulator transcription factor [Clostridia bacterium]|nr:response regulator transcription factor [Clostridia bacterium]
MKRILVIEDEQGIAEVERDYLELEGFEVVVEENGASGLKRALGESFDLLILDLMLPDMDGYAICSRLREEQDIPILIVSAKTEKIDKLRGLGFGADDYITKPFDPAELLARVKAHLARYERIKGSSDRGIDINYRDLTIQPLSRRVFFMGAEVSLTAKEFDLLYYLASNPNRVLSKDKIFSDVWGMQPYGDSGTVVVHLTHVREKIPMDYIETVRGVGYRFTMLSE